MSDPCNRAMSQFSKGDLSGALNNINRCQKSVKKKMRKYKRQEDVLNQLRLQLSKAYQFEGQIYFKKQNTGKAYNGFSQAKKVLNAVPTSDEMLGLRGQLNYSLGLIALMRNKYDKAINLLEKSKEDYFDADMGEHALEVLLRLGRINRQLGNFEASVEFFKKVNKNRKKVSDKTEQRNIEGLSKLEEGKTLKLMNSGKPEKLFKKAKKLYSKTNNQVGQAECLIELGSIHEDDDIEKAKDYYLEALDLGKIDDSPEIKGLALTRLGIISLKNGDFEKGKEKLLEGLKFRTEAGDKVGTAQTLVELSRISLITARNEENMENAKKFAEQAVGLYRETNSRYGMAKAQELLASIDTRLGNYSEAADNAREGKDIYSEYNDINGEARMLTQLGLILDGMNNSQEAIPVLEKAIKLFEKTENQQGKAEALHVLATQLKDDPERATELLKKSKQIYQDVIGNNKELQVILNAIDKKIESLKD